MVIAILRLCLTETFFLEEEEQHIPEYKSSYATLPENFTYIDDPCIAFHQRDQGSCGSCWATATAMAIGERRCLKYGEKKLISIQEFVSCDNTRAYGVTNSGCHGGHPIPAQMYSNKTGTTYEDCFEYFSIKTYYPYPNLTCQQTCDDKTAKPRVFTTSPVRISGEQNIMEEIYKNGPVPVSMRLYSDFAKQIKNDGIYIQNSTTQAGGHAVVLIGWGVRDGIKYWQAQNTYGPKWGNAGFFKIRRGTNEARIEQEVSYSLPLGGTVNKEPVVKFVTQPTDVKVNTTQSFKVQVQNVAELYAYVYTSSGTLYKRLYNPWINHDDISKAQNITLQYYIENPNTYYIQLTTNSTSVKSGLFKATAPAGKINHPVSGQIVLQSDSLRIQTSDLDGHTVYLGGVNQGKILNGQLSIVVPTTLTNSQTLQIAEQQVSITVLPRPSFEKATYQGEVGQKVTMQIVPKTFNYKNYITVTYQGARYKANDNNQVTISLKMAGSSNAVLSVDNYNGYQHIAQINSTMSNSLRCSIDVEHMDHYLINKAVTFTSDCTGTFYLIKKGLNKTLTAMSFTPTERGSYKICNKKVCSKIIEVYDMHVSINQKTIQTLHNNSVSGQIQHFISNNPQIVIQYFCRDTNRIDNVEVAKLEPNFAVKLMGVNSCAQGYIRVRTLSAPFKYGDSQVFKITEGTVPSDNLVRPWEFDPMMEPEEVSFDDADTEVKPDPTPEPEPEPEEGPTEPDDVVPDKPQNTAFELYYPSNNMTVHNGQNIKIMWATNLDVTGKVTLNLYSNTGGGLVEKITTDAPNNGEFAYTIPNSLTSGSYYISGRLVYGSKYTSKADIKVIDRLVYSYTAKGLKIKDTGNYDIAIIDSRTKEVLKQLRRQKDYNIRFLEKINRQLTIRQCDADNNCVFYKLQ